MVAVTFLGLMAITFFIGRIIPIDPVLSVVGDRASQETYDAMRLKMGLDQPLIVQFGPTWAACSGAISACRSPPGARWPTT
jgi:peptide/nickel transport system permease protein